MITSPSIQILLATYNGARFLQEQLDSLFAQTRQDFTLLVRDDGSTDNTLQIVRDYQQRYPDRIRIITDRRKNLGATRNFGCLLEHADADYIFCCDQDDIWKPDKVEMEMREMAVLEQADTTVPCLVFSDMMAIDEVGHVQNDSVWQQLHLHPDFFTLNRLLVQNIPHGCTMLINRPMRNLAVPLPKEALLHDHWIALLAASCGRWKAISEPTVLLRNHGSNVTRKQTGIFDKVKRFSQNFLDKSEYEHFIQMRVRQALALQLRTSTFISDDDFDILKDFIRLGKTKGMERRKIMWKRQFFRTTAWHTFKMIARA